MQFIAFSLVLEWIWQWLATEIPTENFIFFAEWQSLYLGQKHLITTKLISSPFLVLQSITKLMLKIILLSPRFHMLLLWNILILLKKARVVLPQKPLQLSHLYPLKSNPVCIDLFMFQELHLLHVMLLDMWFLVSLTEENAKLEGFFQLEEVNPLNMTFLKKLVLLWWYLFLLKLQLVGIYHQFM